MSVLPVVAIVGRPNVGKSTLFNRIARGRPAIVENEPGVTRDRLYRQSEWLGRQFIVVDTGGLEVNPGDDVRKEVQRQTALAVDESDVVIFVVDVREGITHDDEMSAEVLRRSGKRVVLAVNKVDHPNHRPGVDEFYRMGLGEPVPVSAEHGLNLGDLLDRVIEGQSPAEAQERADEVPRVALLGRPNVGKSSLINALLSEERVIVSHEPGTTRDAIDVECVLMGQEMVFVDTAGLRRKARVQGGVERFSVLRALRAASRSTVVVLMLDATGRVSTQDQRIAGYLNREGKPLIVAINKWDLHVGSGLENEINLHLDDRLDFVHYAPRIFISALTGLNLDQLPQLITRVWTESTKRISTGQLNRALEDALLDNPPPRRKGRELKILFVTQVGVGPPEFVFFVNNPDLVHFSYQRYLENEWRRRFGFEGSPMVFHFRPRSRDQGE